MAINRPRSKWYGVRTLGETRWRCGGLGAREVRVGRARARAGGAWPLRASPSLGAFPAPTHGRQARFKPSGWRRRQPSVGSSAAAQAVSAAMPSTPARTDTPLAMAWWPRDLGGCAPCQADGMALSGGPVGAGARGWPPDPAQPTPASRRHAVRAPPRHGSWPPCTPCLAVDRARRCGFPSCDGILCARMTDPQAGRRRWAWLISAISRVGLLWWSGSCRHHFSTSPDFQCSAPTLLVLQYG